MSSKDSNSPIDRLKAYSSDSDELNALIETPKGSRNKFKWEPSLGLFTLSSVLPAGAVFPFDFGFIPGTLGDDGDPLDVLILMDEPAFTGCLVKARLIGVFEAEQTENGQQERNDRLVAVAVESKEHKDLRQLDQLSSSLLEQIEHFFVSYEEVKGKPFKILKRGGPDLAKKLVDKGIAAYKE